jgi:hypothetical protein
LKVGVQQVKAGAHTLLMYSRCSKDPTLQRIVLYKGSYFTKDPTLQRILLYKGSYFTKGPTSQRHEKNSMMRRHVQKSMVAPQWIHKVGASVRLVVTGRSSRDRPSLKRMLCPQWTYILSE